MAADENELMVIGGVLMKLQGFEFNLKVFVSLFNKEAKQRNPKIKNLTANNILDDSIPNRRQTLGVLAGAIKAEIDVFDENEFNKLLKLRNDFIHSFHKRFNIEKASGRSEFLDELQSLLDKYIKIFNGLLSISLKKLAKDLDGQIDMGNLVGDEASFLKYLSENIKT